MTPPASAKQTNSRSRQRPRSQSSDPLTNELWRLIQNHPRSQSDKTAEMKLATTLAALCAAGADANQERPHPMGKDYGWRTALSLALCSSLEHAAVALLPYADPLKIDKGSQNCDLLMNASSRPLALRALIAAGADPLRTDDLGRNALMYALRFDTSKPQASGLRVCVEMLLPISDALVIDRDQQSVFDWAAKRQGGLIHAELLAIVARQEAQALELSCGRGSNAKTLPPRL